MRAGHFAMVRCVDHYRVLVEANLANRAVNAADTGIHLADVSVVVRRNSEPNRIIDLALRAAKRYETLRAFF